MRTILRKTSSGLFFQGPDQWTGDPAQARNFRTIDRALQFIETWRLRDVEIAFAFDDAESFTGVSPDKIALRYSEE